MQSVNSFGILFAGSCAVLVTSVR